MAELLVDHEKLTYGLEQGVAEINSLFAHLNPEHRLRWPMCGLVATSIYTYARSNDIDAELYIGSPRIPIDPSMQHVLPAFPIDNNEEELVVDGTYSQFLWYAGMCCAYERIANQPVFPDEKIITFTFSERDLVAQWLTDITQMFQSRNLHPHNFMDQDVGVGPLTDAAASEIHDVYSRIYDPAVYTPWQPPERTIRDSEKVCKYIPAGALEVV